MCGGRLGVGPGRRRLHDLPRADAARVPDELVVEPGHSVVHVPAGPFDLPKEALAEQVDVFADGVGEHLDATGGVDVIHGNYWLSGVAGHRLKHRFDVPLVSTFHTLARVKAEGGDLEPEWRDRAEAEVIGCSDAICVSCPEEERQFPPVVRRPHGVIETVPPAVEHAFFAPGDRRGARRAIGLPADRPIILFVGRIQPLKGPDVAVRALAGVHRGDALLVLVGGASGSTAPAELAATRSLAADLGVADRVVFVEPKPHHLLSSYYRAADVVIVPSRGESFGLVALRGGGLRHPRRRQRCRRVAQRRPRRRHRAARRGTPPRALRPCPCPSDRRSRRRRGDGRRLASVRARRFTWSFTAARLRRLYADLVEQRTPLVVC